MSLPSGRYTITNMAGDDRPVGLGLIAPGVGPLPVFVAPETTASHIGPRIVGVTSGVLCRPPTDVLCSSKLTILPRISTSSRLSRAPNGSSGRRLKKTLSGLSGGSMRERLRLTSGELLKFPSVARRHTCQYWPESELVGATDCSSDSIETPNKANGKGWVASTEDNAQVYFPPVRMQSRS